MRSMTDACNLIFASVALAILVLLGDWVAEFIPQPRDSVSVAPTPVSTRFVLSRSGKGDRLVPASVAFREPIPFGCETASSPLAKEGAYLPVARCLS